MMLLRLIEFIAIVFALAFILTQAVVPLATGRKLFPAFRKSRNKIEDEIREVQEQLDEKELQTTLHELHEKLEGHPEVPVTTPVSASTATVSPPEQTDSRIHFDK
jgi:hypothetical protein